MAALLALVCIQGLIGLGQGVASLIGAAKARETQEKAERVRNELREAKRIQMEQDAEHATALQTAMDDSATVQYNITTGLSTWQQQCKQLLPTFITACNTSGVIKAKSSRLQEIDKLFQEFDGCFKWMEKYLNIRGHSQAILAQKYWYFRRALNRLEQFVKKAKKLCTRCPSLAVSLNAILVIPEEQLRFFRHYCGLGSHAIKYPENINAYNHVMRRAISYTISDQPEPPMIQCKHDYVLTWLHFGSLGSTAHFKEGWLTLQSVAVTNRSPKVYVILKSQASKLLDGNQVEYRGHCAVIKYGPNLFVEVGCCGKKDHGK